MGNNKVTLHRVFGASPEKVFRAFTDPDAIASWIPPLRLHLQSACHGCENWRNVQDVVYKLHYRQ